MNDMRINPCRSCPLIDEDKNNLTCLRCDKRVAYIQDLDRQLRCTPCRWNEDGPVIHQVVLPELPFPRITG
jgi:hypothetical protein